jgi:sec-independent protein translocase protein TatB
VFNIGPMELAVLVVVGLIVLGPERLPDLARDAGRLLRSLRDIAQGARTQLRDELGPEFADLDLRNLNPKTAIRRAVLGDDFDADEYRFSPKQYLQDAMADEPEQSISLKKANGAAPEASRPRPRPRPYPAAEAPTPYDSDAT